VLMPKFVAGSSIVCSNVTLVCATVILIFLAKVHLRIVCGSQLQ